MRRYPIVWGFAEGACVISVSAEVGTLPSVGPRGKSHKEHAPDAAKGCVHACPTLM